MTIADQITRLNNAKANIKQAIENKGVTVSDSALLDEYPALINSIPMEGGDPYYEDLYNLRTSNGTNMAGMFYYCNAPELDLRNLDVSKVTSMNYMFNNCSSSVNIDGWDTSNVTNMSRMFYQFTGSIDVSKLDTSKVTEASYMFYYANTDKIVLTGMSFPSTKSLSNMFNYASGTTLDLSSWDISNITSMYYMFSNTNYKRIDLTGWNTTNVTDMTRMFYKTSNPLEELIIPDWDMTNCSHNIFYNSSYIPNLTLIDLSRSNDATITKIASFLPTRTATTSGTVLVPVNTSQGVCDTLAAKYWTAQKPEGYIPLYVPGEFQYNMEITEVRTMVDESHNDLSYMFSMCMSLVSVNTEDWDTSNVTNMNSMFNGCHSLPSLDISNFNTSNVTNMSSMFYGCAQLTQLDVSNFNTSNVTDMSSMFNNCYSLTSLDVSKWDTSNVTSMDNMFGYCNFLSTIGDLSNWDTSKVTNMNSMFSGCGLTSLDVSDWDISKVTDMGYMFSGCTSLQSLDLSNWDTSNVSSMNGMIDSCYFLQELRLDNCSKDTISKIITSSNLPTDNYGGTRTIYCKKSEAAGLTPPEGWVFSYVDVPLYVSGKFQNNTEITEVITMVDKSHYDLSYMFSGCSNLVSVNTEDWDTSYVYSMSSMFSGCTSLQSLDLSNFNTAMAGFMSMMFFNCTSLTTLNLSNWDTASLFMPEMDMENMFGNCNSLHTLRLDNCSNDTINKIINSPGFPTNAIEGVTRTIYCKEENAAGLTAPENWVFSYVD